ncbi:MAG: NAD(P)H-quinone oxidoreductase subunit N [Leptolyngbyaceae cyanobacterium SM1_1_3]|nr:NAD(P)H-quinone oxidoreductase subunit N [Leptolyngbyaceae cyanobacterium SM1_1_3]NJN03161.1 NAD(P)H-quinone oxidoreductase subunit N [Leptolyngbyaceae cyanobacterium RM1_1_2]NJO08916.1 NAD(P)H-quinone oxidoreductase subunit N [Leptolyngbyaceae cyanobacterium SL_1_1]
MPLLITGKKFIQQLEQSGALAVKVPLEGGFEGRYQRRLRAVGYETFSITARGLGDLSAYLLGVHGIRPPHLGKKTTGQSAAVGFTYYIPPVLGYRVETLSPQSKGLLVWILEGHILSRQEVQYLAGLPKTEPQVKVVVEMGGDRVFSWMPLQQAV